MSHEVPQKLDGARFLLELQFSTGNGHIAHRLCKETLKPLISQLHAEK